jgi:hypothetical protein
MVAFITWKNIANEMLTIFMCVSIFSTMKILLEKRIVTHLVAKAEEACSSETLVFIYKTTRRHIQEDRSIKSHRHGNPKFCYKFGKSECAVTISTTGSTITADRE